MGSQSWPKSWSISIPILRCAVANHCFAFFLLNEILDQRRLFCTACQRRFLIALWRFNEPVLDNIWYLESILPDFLNGFHLSEFFFLSLRSCIMWRLGKSRIETGKQGKREWFYGCGFEIRPTIFTLHFWSQFLFCINPLPKRMNWMVG